MDVTAEGANMENRFLVDALGCDSSAPLSHQAECLRSVPAKEVTAHTPPSWDPSFAIPPSGPVGLDWGSAVINDGITVLNIKESFNSPGGSMDVPILCVCYTSSIHLLTS